MGFYEKFVRLCAERNVSMTAAAEAIGLSNAAQTRWKKGNSPSPVNLVKLADYFGVPVSYFEEESDIKESLTSLRDCDRALLEVSRTMNEADVYRIRDFLRGMKDAH